MLRISFGAQANDSSQNKFILLNLEGVHLVYSLGVLGNLHGVNEPRSLRGFGDFLLHEDLTVSEDLRGRKPW